MSSRKKHLRYRAAKQSGGAPSLTAGEVMPPTGGNKGAHYKPENTSVAAPATEKSKKAIVDVVFTQLSSREVLIIKRELRHIILVAFAVALVYTVLWTGFRYGDWAEIVLRYIPHGQ